MLERRAFALRMEQTISLGRTANWLRNNGDAMAMPTNPKFQQRDAEYAQATSEEAARVGKLQARSRKLRELRLAGEAADAAANAALKAAKPVPKKRAVRRVVK